MLPLQYDRSSKPQNSGISLTRHLNLPKPLGRYLRRFILLGITIWALYLLRNVREETRQKIITRSFELIRNYERNLPQNSLYHPNRMVKFSNEVWGLGLNNQLNNRLLLSHIAYLSKRAYVFQDVMFGDTWNANPWYPLNTFISGPTAGGAFPRGTMAPRAISTESWEQNCPIGKRTLLNATIVNQELGLEHDISDGPLIIERWGQKLLEISDSCVEITPLSEHIIDFYFFGSPKSLSLWPTFSTSPVVKGFKWSSTVLEAVRRNIPLITGREVFSREEPNLQNVLALHIRRGDFESHCTHMTHYASGYNSWNLLPELPDKYTPPNSPSIDDPQDLAVFMRHCWPSIEDIVRRVNEVKTDHDALEELPQLDTIYVLTNGRKEWADELKKALLKSQPTWKRVTTSRDLPLKQGPEKVAAQAVDMAIASKAGSLIGNGFSTLTANVVMFRLLDGKDPQTCRMW